MFSETISPEAIEPLELVSFPGKIHVITEEGPELDAAVEHLKAQRVIGFDTETRPVFQPHVPRNHTALLQLSSETDAFLFRLNHLGLPASVVEILSDPYITKVGAAVLDDIYGLCHYRTVHPNRFIDLQTFAYRYGVREKSIRKMTAIVLGRKVSKAQQCSNWEAEPLSEAQQLYAATDAWICVQLYRKLLGSPFVKLEHLPGDPVFELQETSAVAKRRKRK